jgi:hypothetical protein
VTGLCVQDEFLVLFLVSNVWDVECIDNTENCLRLAKSTLEALLKFEI